MIRPADCWDPPATSSHARKCLIVGTHLVEAYVALSFWSRTCTYMLVDVEARTCRSRGAHVACTRTYNGQGARKKIRPRMCTYGQGLERLLAHLYVRPGLVYMARSERRNSIVVVLMGRQQNASCSWGGNGMRRVHREATERVGANRLGQNRMRHRVRQEGLDGTGDGNEAWRTVERRKRPCV